MWQVFFNFGVEMVDYQLKKENKHYNFYFDFNVRCILIPEWKFQTKRIPLNSRDEWVCRLNSSGTQVRAEPLHKWVEHEVESPHSSCLVILSLLNSTHKDWLSLSLMQFESYQFYGSLFQFWTEPQIER